jgi:hypothetical protein
MKLHIRNSTTEFLIFAHPAGEGGIELRIAEASKPVTVAFARSGFEICPFVQNRLSLSDFHRHFELALVNSTRKP